MYLTESGFSSIAVIIDPLNFLASSIANGPTPANMTQTSSPSFAMPSILDLSKESLLEKKVFLGSNLNMHPFSLYSTLYFLLPAR